MTQMLKAGAGEITQEVQGTASREGISPEVLAEKIARGTAVLPANKIRAERSSYQPCAIGEGLKTKVNANTGTSREQPERKPAVKKARRAEACGADAVMDLSTGGDLDRVRREIFGAVNIPLGTVPVYQAAMRGREERGAMVEMTSEDMFKAVERHCEDGVDFITVHCGINSSIWERIKNSSRVTPVVSRGGSFTLAWMYRHQAENPYYRDFDRLLDLALRYDVTLSLGDGLRPGCIADATDGPQVQELIILGELVRRAREAGVQVMVEGPGHVPLDQVKSNVVMQKRLCHEAPFYVLGPLVTDIAPGYDHLVSAMGGALAAASGADFLCFVTPDEHLSIPDVEAVEEGVMASRIAAHAGDIAKGIPGAADWDRQMSLARKDLHWEKQQELAINPEKVARARCLAGPLEEGEGCTMCGDFCAFKIMQEVLS